MIARAGSGWQTVLADLSLILFMLTAATLSQTPETGGGQNGETASQQSEPVAVYATGNGAPPLADWLLDQPHDPRQQLTIVAHYTAGGQDAALAQATVFARTAGQSGLAARIIVEPGQQAGVTATLAYDAPVARPGARPDADQPSGTPLAVMDGNQTSRRKLP
jgi:hypothetical protein